MQPRQIPPANSALLKNSISSVIKKHDGFKMLCESFAVTLREFEQIFALNEAVFSIWDPDSNGMVDCIEFFTVLIIFAEGRVEDKLRLLMELFDFD